MSRQMEQRQQTLRRRYRQRGMRVRPILAAAVAAGAFAASSDLARATAFWNLKLLAFDVTTGGSTYSSSVSVNAGDTIAYELVGNMSPIGTVNSNPTTFGGTITSRTTGPDGANSFKIDLFQNANEAIQASFTSAGTLINGWAGGPGPTGGTPSGTDLTNV